MENVKAIPNEKEITIVIEVNKLASTNISHNLPFFFPKDQPILTFASAKLVIFQLALHSRHNFKKMW